MDDKLQAFVDYKDEYVQPIILAALAKVLPSSSYALVETLPDSSQAGQKCLQFRSYESLDFEYALCTDACLINSYVIRKALIRKHYLSATVFSWVTKHPTSALKKHFEPSVEFELDYAEFLDDALIEAYELRDSLERNKDLHSCDREWWILKPGMSDRGQGIRLFSTEEELTSIFEAWEAENPEDEEDEDDDDDDNDDQSGRRTALDMKPNGKQNEDFIMTSHLRHFVAQPYIQKPLLFDEAPYLSRKFHVRTYIVAAGALRVFIFEHMLALFASEPYEPPWKTAECDADTDEGMRQFLEHFKNTHLTNTCVQNAQKLTLSDRETANQEHVFLLSDLPLTRKDHENIQQQISDTVSEVFQAALAQSTAYQPLPCSFEIFGLDFLIAESEPHDSTDASRLNVSLLEVNAFPDFAQTGDYLKEVVVQGLFEEVASQIIAPFFDIHVEEDSLLQQSRLRKVLSMDLRR